MIRLEVAVFGRKGIPNYQESKDLVNVFVEDNNLGRSIKCACYDIDTVEGLAKACFHDVRKPPAILVINRDDKVVARWDGGVVPSREDLVSTVLVYS